MIIPEGFGYRYRASDRWLLNHMIHNLTPRRMTLYVSYQIDLPDRALQTLIQLLAVVVFSLLALAPGQSNTALGLELVALAIPLTLASAWLINRALNAAGGGSPLDRRRIVIAAGTAPFVIGGASLIVEQGGGLYWLLAGVIAAVIGGVLNAWVLLVEILR